ncbi:GIY-YIG nuclease family protein [Escherichia coli]|uniref:GIY-YIG nuclease family protein n=1 Tax=Escherichia coli TaxID=562 RepID=UPI0023422C57|nr:GIY-YIG nuclease family protein [Escherichia coli]MDC3512330.1 GIY-YIG nuclease family protein [Escherichia coli]
MEIKFASEFTDVKPRRLEGLLRVEADVQAKCKQINYTYNGFVVSDNKPTAMRLSLTCNEHNETWNTTEAKAFISKEQSGCTGCFAHKRAVGGKTTPKDKILAKANAACKKYNLVCDGIEEGEYINQDCKIKISCADCGRSLTPVKIYHLISKGRVCRECSKAKTIAKEEAEKIVRLNERTDFVYGRIIERNKETGFILRGIVGDMQGTDFIIRQRCPTHNHNFSVTWTSFKGGTKGCKYCNTSAFRTDIPVYFYIQSLDDRYIKFGVTNRKVERRMVEQQRESVFTHRLIKSFRFSKGEHASKLEKLIKTKYECGVVSRDDMRDGYTETLPFEALPEIITITNKMISESILMPK